MKKQLTIFLLFSLTTISFAQDAFKKKTIKTFYQVTTRKGNLKDGSIKEEYEVLESNETTKNGFYRKYSAYETLLMEGFYLNDKKNGLWKTYENGIMYSEGEFKDDFLEGKWIFYFDKNKIKAEGTYKKDIKIGLWKYYRTNGILNYEINCNEYGLANGLSKFYDSKGNLQISCNFKNGNEDGETIHYFDNGNFRCKIKYKNNTKCDSAFSYFDDKKLLKQVFYNDTTLLNSTTFYHSGKIKNTKNIIDSTSNKYRLITFYENQKIKCNEISNDSILFSRQNSGKNGEALDNGTYIDGNGLLLEYDDDTLISETYYKNYKKNGGYTSYYHNKNIAAIGQYFDNEKIGTWNFYSDLGNKNNTVNFDLNENAKRGLIEYDNSTNEKIYDRAETMPVYDGGIPELMKFLSKNIRYPSIARENGLEGKVIIKFYLDNFGFINDIDILKDGIGGGCAEEAARVVSLMPRWQPGYQDGFPVNVYYTLPVSFKLQ